MTGLSGAIGDATRPRATHKRPLLRGNPPLPFAKVPTSPRLTQGARLLASHMLLAPLCLRQGLNKGPPMISS
eukprot:7208153-Pyramimonas_sp.AAC.1